MGIFHASFRCCNGIENVCVAELWHEISSIQGNAENTWATPLVKKLNQIICIILLLQGTHYLTHISQSKNILNVKVELTVENIDLSLKYPSS